MDFTKMQFFDVEKETAYGVKELEFYGNDCIFREIGIAVPEGRHAIPLKTA